MCGGFCQDILPPSPTVGTSAAALLAAQPSLLRPDSPPACLLNDGVDGGTSGAEEVEAVGAEQL